MRKVYCDHCGKDITHASVNELDYDDCFLLNDKRIGHGCELCDACYEERARLHAELDATFLHVEGQNA